jgi:hypothetical protein
MKNHILINPLLLKEQEENETEEEAPKVEDTPQIEALEEYLQLLTKLKDSESVRQRVTGDAPEMLASEKIRMQVLRSSVLKPFDITGETKVKEIEAMLEDEREKLKKPLEKPKSKIDPDSDDGEEQDMYGKIFGEPEDREEDKEEEETDSTVTVTFKANVDGAPATVFVNGKKAPSGKYSGKPGEKIEAYAKEPGENGSQTRIYQVTLGQADSTINLGFSTGITKALRDLQFDESLSKEYRETAGEIADILEDNLTLTAIGKLVEKYGLVLTGFDPTKAFAPEPFASIFTAAIRSFQTRGDIEPTAEQEAEFREYGETMSIVFSTWLAYIVQARIRRAALYKNLGDNSEFAKAKGGQSATKGKSVEELATIVRNSKFMRPTRNPVEYFRTTVKGSWLPEWWNKNIALDKHEWLDSVIEKEAIKVSNNLKDSLASRSMDKVGSVLITTLRGEAAAGGAVRQFVSILGNLVMSDGNILAGELKDVVEVGLSPDNLRKFNDDLQNLIDDPDLRDVSTRDKFMMAFLDGKYANKLIKGKDDATALEKAIAATDQKMLNKGKNLFKGAALGLKKLFLDQVADKLADFVIDMIKDGVDAAAGSANRFMSDYRDELLFQKDPVVKDIMDRKRAGQMMPVPVGTPGRVARPLSPDQALAQYRRRQGQLGGTAGAKAAEAVAKMQNALSRLKDRVLRRALEEQKEGENKSPKALDSGLDLSHLKNMVDKERAELEKEEKEYNNLISDFFGFKSDEGMEQVFDAVYKLEIEDAINNIDFDNIANIGEKNLRSHLNLTRQNFIKTIYSQLPQDDGTRGEEPQSRDMSLQEGKIKITKSKLIDLISEQVKEQTQTVDVTKDQLVALVAQEAFKQINRKK